MAENELVYLKKQLGFVIGEWQKLDDVTKEWYRAAARAEMEFISSNV